MRTSTTVCHLYTVSSTYMLRSPQKAFDYLHQRGYVFALVYLLQDSWKSCRDFDEIFWRDCMATGMETID